MNTKLVLEGAAYGRFYEGLDGAERLADTTGDPVYQASSIVLLCALWEAFLEDSVLECVEHLLSHVEAEELPRSLRRAVASSIRSSKHELSPWSMIGESWRDRVRDVVKMRAQRLNTPSFEHTCEFLKLLDLHPDWSRKWTNPEPVQKRLDRYVHSRHEIAHRGAAAQPITREQCEEFFGAVSHVALITLSELDSCCLRLTRSSPFVKWVPEAPVS